MPKIHKRQCDNCKEQYAGRGKKYCSNECKGQAYLYEGNSKWMGGIISGDRYDYIKDHNNPRANDQGYVPLSVHIVEEHLGRRLDAEQIIHHIDEDKRNNRLENLFIFPTGKLHNAYHSGGLKEILLTNLDYFKNE